MTASGIGATGVGTILGGAGADTITFSGITLLESVKLGDGSDQLNWASGFDYSGTSLYAGGGSDKISGGTARLGDAFIGLGAGNDTLLLSGGNLNTATIEGGGGNDSISLTAASTTTGLTIGLGKGTDFIQTQVLDSGSTVKGGGGADTIDLSGEQLSGLYVAGGAGGDSIVVADIAGDDAGFIGGGAGSDVITISSVGSLSGANTIQGGGGADSINVSGGTLGASAMVFGGAGADQIGIGTLKTGTGAIIGYSALSDSTDSVMDVVSGTYVTGSIVQYDFSGAVTSTTLGSYSGTNLSVNGGIATGGGFSANSIASAASLMDTYLQEEGTVVMFQQSGTNYLFIQGGASGTTDDAVISIESGMKNSGAGISIAVSATSEVNLTFNSAV